MGPRHKTFNQRQLVLDEGDAVASPFFSVIRGRVRYKFFILEVAQQFLHICRGVNLSAL